MTLIINRISELNRERIFKNLIKKLICTALIRISHILSSRSPSNYVLHYLATGQSENNWIMTNGSSLAIAPWFVVFVRCVVNATSPEISMVDHNNGRRNSWETWTNRWKRRGNRYWDRKPTADVVDTAVRICIHPGNAFACSHVCAIELEIKEKKRNRKIREYKNNVMKKIDI